MGKTKVRIRKEVIRPGTYFYRDKAGTGRLLTATPEHIKYWHDSGNAMRAAGLPIPAPLEHDPSAHPMTPAEKLLNNAGEVHDYEIGDVTETGADGKPVTVKDVLFSNVEIKKPEAIQGINDGTIRWTSPSFDSFTDGTGRPWKGVITHLALTSRPVLSSQQPFPASFSLTPESSPPATLPAVSLSRAGLVRESRAGVFAPVYPVAFSLWTGAKFAQDGGGPPKKEKPDGESEDKGEDKEGGEAKGDGGNPFGKDKEGGGEGEGKFGGKGGEAKPKFDPMTGEPIKEPLVDPDGDVSMWCVVADMLSALLGVEVGEVTAENGLEKVYEVVREAMKAKMSEAAAPAAEPAKEATQTTPPPPSNPIIQEQQPMYMSLEQANAIADPTMKQIALSLIESQKKNKALESKLFNDATAARQKRINAILRVMPSLKDDLDKLTAGAQFSLSDTGTVNDPVDGWLGVQERVLALLPTLLKTPASELSVAPQPEETNGPVPAERVKDAREQLKRAHHGAA